ncbi:hypothetical protein Avbf_11189 [Armadillidium vulgare]|nr:hypothetical protein Avbf_11189 [Armadillidium vulgare]
MYRRTVHDIDLFPAGIAEFKVPGGQVSSISATRLSSLICLFTNVDAIQPNVMLPHTGKGGIEQTKDSFEL